MLSNGADWHRSSNLETLFYIPRLLITYRFLRPIGIQSLSRCPRLISTIFANILRTYVHSEVETGIDENSHQSFRSALAMIGKLQNCGGSVLTPINSQLRPFEHLILSIIVKG